MTEKTKVKREAVKPMKKKRKLSEETKEKLRVRLAEMRAKRNLLNIRMLLNLF